MRQLGRGGGRTGAWLPEIEHTGAHGSAREAQRDQGAQLAVGARAKARYGWRMRVVLSGALLLLAIACGDAEFDRVRWASGSAAASAERPSDWDNPRAAMVDDVERAGLAPGARRAFVRELLGTPDVERPNVDVYVLGASPYGVDYDEFVVEYNEAGVVTRAHVVQG